MSKVPRITNTSRFFSTFQRYMTLTTTSQPHTHTPPRNHSKFHQHQLSPSIHSTTIRHASTTQPPTPQPSPPTLYSLFPLTLPHGPPPHGPFNIDTTALRREFLQLQARAHPDRHPGASKAKAEGTSALINEAYATLQDPLRRAQYLLSLRGIDVAEDEGLKVEDDEGLLMEVMEVREAIEAAGEEGELEGVRRGNEGNIGESVRVLEGAFRDDDLERAVGEAVRLRYWVNIRESLDGWERGKPVVLVH